MMTTDMHALAGAYALDALPGDERAFFERHLQVCETCESEVSELTETAAALAVGTAEPPPARLRERLLAEIDVTRQLPPAPAEATPDGRRGWRERLQPVLAPVAAALVLVVFALAGVIGNLNDRVGELQQTASRDDGVVEVLTAGDVRTADLQLSNTETARFVYSERRDQAVLVGDGLRSPGQGKAYQLWLLDGSAPQSGAVFVPDADGRVTADVVAALAGADQIALTIEPAGGSPAPTSEVLAAAELTRG